MADKPTTADDILRHLAEIHQEAADREDLPDWIRSANAEMAKQIRRTLEQPEEDEMNGEPIDTEFCDAPVCPYCGHKETDAWEIDFGPSMEGDVEFDCADCGRSMFISRHVAVTYSTRKT